MRQLPTAGRLILLLSAAVWHCGGQTTSQPKGPSPKASPPKPAPSAQAAAKPPIQVAIDAYLKDNVAVAEKNLRGLAGTGDTYAQTLLAQICKACSEADEVRWLQSAVKQGDTRAMSALASHYSSGRGVEKDQALQDKLLTDAQAGQPTSKVAQDYAEPVKYLTQLSKSGNHAATRELAEMYLNSWGVPRNEGEAFRMRLSLANSGDERAQAEVGELYRTGKGVGRDYQQAVYWCRSASTKGSCALGAECLSKLFFEGLGVADDLGAIERCFQSDSSRTSRQGMFYNQIADAYWKGKNVPKNAVEAFKWREKAAEFGWTPALSTLADAYLDGMIFDGAAKDWVSAGVQKDLERGEYWYSKYIEQTARWKETPLKATWMDRARRSEMRGDLATAERLFKRAAEAGEVDSGRSGEKRTAQQALLDLYLNAGFSVSATDQPDYRGTESLLLKALQLRDVDEGVRNKTKRSLQQLYERVLSSKEDVDIGQFSPLGVLYAMSLVRARAYDYLSCYRDAGQLLKKLGVKSSEIYFQSAVDGVKEAQTEADDCQKKNCQGLLKAQPAMALGRYSEALRAMRDEMEKDVLSRSQSPNRTVLRNWSHNHDFRGQIHAALGNMMPAMEDFDTALRYIQQAQDAEGQGQIYFNRAMSLIILGQFESAAKECRNVTAYTGRQYVKDICKAAGTITGAGPQLAEAEKLSRDWYGEIFDLVRPAVDISLPPIAKPGSPPGTAQTAIPRITPNVSAGPPSTASTATPPLGTPTDGPVLAIARIRGRQHSAMPLAQALGGKSDGCEISFENGTQYDITVYLSGPTSKSVSLPAGATSSLNLAPGQYEIAAEIPNNSSFQPLYGSRLFSRTQNIESDSAFNASSERTARRSRPRRIIAAVSTLSISKIQKERTQPKACKPNGIPGRERRLWLPANTTCSSSSSPPGRSRMREETSSKLRS